MRWSSRNNHKARRPTRLLRYQARETSHRIRPRVGATENEGSIPHSRGAIKIDNAKPLGAYLIFHIRIDVTAGTIFLRRTSVVTPGVLRLTAGCGRTDGRQKTMRGNIIRYKNIEPPLATPSNMINFLASRISTSWFFFSRLTHLV